MPLHIVSEAQRCLNCKKPLCQEGCPVHTPIPTVIQLFKEKKLMEAGEMLFQNNPMSAICSIVCNHEQQCAGKCIRGKKDTPVHFSSIENYISEMYLDRAVLEKKPSNGKRVAVIGSGPAGLTAAIRLAMEGYSVTIFEWKSRIGGLMLYGIPEFRLPKSILDRYLDVLRKLGVQIRLNTTIGTVLLIENLFRDGYSSIFIGTGAAKARSLGIEGESLANVHFGVDYLANPHSHLLGDRVAVIGMGNAAMDVARTALRTGSRYVTLYSVDKTIAASSHEQQYALLDGAEFVFGKKIARITEQGPVFRSAVFDENDNVLYYEEEEELIPADSTIVSISQTPRAKLVRTTDGLEAAPNGALLVDENNMTTLPGVFAAGDAVTGPKTVVHAVDGAKKAAEAMIRYMEQKENG